MAFFGSIYDAHRLFNHYGIAPGDYFSSWVHNIIKKYTGDADITFEKFEALKETKGFKSIYFIGANLNSDDWKRTLYVNTLDVGTLDFAIREAKKRALIESGRQGVERYFAWYDAAVKQAA